jgi:TRAP-type mannitol/chloroaromatic compound transport system permease large subunit
VEIIFIVVPIAGVPLMAAGVDPVWFAILLSLNLQTSFLTPPMAMSCYYLKGVAPPDIQLSEIFKGTLPFLSMVLVAMVVVYTIPQATTWLPTLIYGAF